MTPRKPFDPSRTRYKPRNVVIRQEHRRRQVEKLYIQGKPISVIAEDVGASTATIQQDIKYIRDCWRTNHAQIFSEVNAKELAKLDLMEQAMWPQALDGKGYAIERILMIMDHRAKILGLYAPTQSRVEVITGDMLREEIKKMEQRERELREAAVVDVEVVGSDSREPRAISAPGSAS